MGLAKWEPFSELRRMRDDMDRLFQTLWQAPMQIAEAPSMAMPAIDVFERDNNIVVKAELPGLNKDDIEITAVDDSITVRGEFKQEQQVNEQGYVRRERRAGRFLRTIPMPAAIQPDQVKATFKDGVLEITAPKSAQAKENETKVPIDT